MPTNYSVIAERGDDKQRILHVHGGLYLRIQDSGPGSHITQIESLDDIPKWVTDGQLSDCIKVLVPAPAPAMVDEQGNLASVLNIVFDHDKTMVEKLSQNAWIGRAVAARRNPDGTWIIRSVAYTWDAELRAEIDAEGDEKKRAELLREYRKHGRQHAETGARHRVIRALTDIKTSYSPEELVETQV